MFTTNTKLVFYLWKYLTTNHYYGILEEIRFFKIKKELLDITKIHEGRSSVTSWPFKRQPQKRVKHTHCFIVFDHFVGLALKGLILVLIYGGEKILFPVNPFHAN